MFLYILGIGKKIQIRLSVCSSIIHYNQFQTSIIVYFSHALFHSCVIVWKGLFSSFHSLKWTSVCLITQCCWHILWWLSFVFFIFHFTNLWFTKEMIKIRQLLKKQIYKGNLTPKNNLLTNLIILTQSNNSQFVICHPTYRFCYAVFIE